MVKLYSHHRTQQFLVLCKHNAHISSLSDKKASSKIMTQKKKVESDAS